MYFYVPFLINTKGGSGLDSSAPTTTSQNPTQENDYWRISADEFEKDTIIHRGTRGNACDVYLCKINGTTAVVKEWTFGAKQEAPKYVLLRGSSFSDIFRDFKVEASLMSLLRHNFVIGFIGGNQLPGHCFLIMELCPKKSLYDYVKNPSDPLSDLQRVNFALEAALSLRQLEIRNWVRKLRCLSKN